MNRDGANESIWQHAAENFIPQSVFSDKDVFDVLVVGGGITGITTALLLQQSGKKCVLAEAATLGFGTTGGTTAHLNNFFDTPYHKVEKDFGADHALLLARGAKESIEMIRKNVADLNINCAFEDKEGYVFALNEKQIRELDDLVAATKKAGIIVDYINHSPFPVPYLKVARIQGQAQFNPVAYIFALAAAFEAAGGVVLQNCRVNEIIDGDILEALTDVASIKARNAVYATHIPVGVNRLHFLCAPYRSYVLAAKLKNNDYPAAVGYDMADPYHYYRTQEIDGEKYLIAGGEDHKTGHEEWTNAPLRRLESYVRSYFDVESVTFRWSSQYYEPADGLPFIGHLPGKPENIYVATGYGGNGMIYGTLAAAIVKDMILYGDSAYAKLFSPSRVKPLAGFHNVVKEGVDVAKEWISGKFPAENLDQLAAMAAGEGRVVQYEDMTVALYKDEQHKLYAVNPGCTHLNCTVSWNESEKSWDCPCHGARFSVEGIVLNGPASKDLQAISLDKTQV